ncbi:MAG TPA: hypothetical protein VLX44_08970 [Xanthobacteraceae bacterium]|nr:hypothetical protein [Xanthobacteraceae bacterium]
MNRYRRSSGERISLARQVFAAVVACAMSLGIIYVVHALTIIFGGSGSDRDVVIALEFAAVAILVGIVLGKEVLQMMGSILKLIKGEKLEETSNLGSLNMVFLTVVVSLLVYFGFMRYVTHMS